MGEDLQLSNCLTEGTGRDIFIKPVLVFSGYAKMHFGLRPVNNVCVIGKPYLRELIYREQKVFSEQEIYELEKEVIPLTVSVK